MMTPTEKAEEIVLKWASTEPKRTPTATLSDLIPMIAAALEEKEQENMNLRSILNSIERFALQSDVPNFALVRGIDMEAIRPLLAKSKGGNS